MKNVLVMNTILQKIIFMLLITTLVFGQEKNYTVSLTRGKLWHSFYLTQDCGPMGDWGRLTYGLDWPGYDPDSLAQSIGGANSYIVSGGFYIAALNDTGKVLGWADFSTKNIDTKVDWAGASNKYLVSLHERRWKNGENYWLQKDNSEAEEIIETKWAINGEWFEPTDNPPLPIAVKRTVRQWSGSQADEDYIIIEYVIENTQRRNDLYDVYLLFTHAISPNYRGWNLLFPNLNQGARNTQSRYYPDEKMAVSWAGDYKATPGLDESYDFFNYLSFDPILNENISIPEFIAPGAVGIKILYAPADKDGIENKINGFAWSAGAPSQDSGPFQEVQGINAKYEATANPLLLTRAFDDANNSAMGESRLYTNFSLGPFDIPARDSIRLVMTEFVGGMSYTQARDPNTTRELVKIKIDSAVNYLSQRIQYNYDNGFRVPMPPHAPVFSISADTDPGALGNVIRFTNEIESIPDPHQGIVDIAGYRIYRSRELPFGRWEKIAEFAVGDETYFNSVDAVYTFTDDKVALGYSYYYSITSFDTGHDSWVVNGDPVVSLESSLFSNRKGPFSTTLRPTDGSVDQVTVVPNPFYRSSVATGVTGTERDILFLNLPAKCTLRIFTVRGDLVKTIHHNNPLSGKIVWNQISDFGQFVKSGMYFFHVESENGDVNRGKFAIIK